MSSLLVLSCAALTLSCWHPSAAEQGGQDLKNAETEEEIPLKDGRTLPIKFRIEVELDMGGVVPAVTPDTLPGWVYDHETSDSPVLSGRFLTNILMVVFEQGASQPDRQAAIDAINGRVVGGVRDHEDDGFYFVLVADDHPDVPGKALVDAMETLGDLPQVALATPEFLFDEEGLDRGGYVPPLPPDSVPEAVLNEIYDPANVIDGSPFITGKIPGNIIWIAFQHDAPQSKKQEAIDFIDGEVVGGLFTDPGGLYFVRISTDGTVEELFEAIEQLEAFDQVRFATPDLNLEWSPNHRGPAEAHGGMGDRVPAIPPDSLPSSALADSIHSPENQISDPRLGNSVPRDIVFVAFHAKATQQERQEVIDLIDGRVIGGLLDWYIVKIATDGTAESLVEAIEALKGLPQVRLAGPHPPEAIPAVREHPSAVEQAPPEVFASISDGAHGGQDHFYFLPPLVPSPEFGGTFDPSRSPVVAICTLQVSGCEPVIAEFTMESGPGSKTVRVDTTAEHYVVNWHTNEFDLDDGRVYRIRVLLEGQEAGHADVRVVASGQDVKGPEMGDRVPALPPDSLPSGPVADSISARENQVSDPRLGNSVPRDIVFVAFHAEATQQERQEAIDLIDGRVIGGLLDWYIVKIATDGTAESLVEAIEALKELPQVRLAGPHPPDVIPAAATP